MIPARGAGGKSYAPAVEPSPDDLPAVGVEDLPADMLLPRLRGVREAGDGQWMACCPAHADGRPSLSVTETGDYKLLVHCHAGCPLEKVLAAVGLDPRHLYPSDYAVFRARKTGKRLVGALNTGRDATKNSSVEVPDNVVESLTAHARSCFLEVLQQRLLPALAGQLGLPLQALADFGVGCHCLSGRPVWVFHERDGCNRVVGVVYRDGRCGAKWCHVGSRRGLILPARPPASMQDHAAPLYITEGHTDTIAVHGAGGLAVGRPSAGLSGSAAHWLGEFLAARPDLWESRPVVVAGDNDDAGRMGAEETARKLGEMLKRTIPVQFPPPPHKDMRDWIAAGSFTADRPHHQ